MAKSLKEDKKTASSTLRVILSEKKHRSLCNRKPTIKEKRGYVILHRLSMKIQCVPHT